MNKNEYNQIEDFLRDESFVRCIKEDNPEDIAIWAEWMAANPGKRALVNDAIAILKGIQFTPPKMEELQLGSALSRLNSTIDHRLAEQESAKQESTTKGRKIRLFAGIAASLVLIFVSYKAISWYQQPNEIIYHTAFGEQLDLKLVDGTEVSLNANSTLRFFSKNAREVWLQGEAFFKVEKKPSTKAKFQVHTAELDIEVLGTAFNVNSLRSETAVMLEEGKVKLRLDNGREETMQSGDLLSYSGKTQQIIKKEEAVSSELYTSWKDGQLIFRNISLREAMQKIEATYGVEVVFEAEELEQRSTSISIGVPTKNLEICINAIQKSMGLIIEQKGQQLIIKEQQ